jgi:hypothetical protein
MTENPDDKLGDPIYVSHLSTARGKSGHFTVSSRAAISRISNMSRCGRLTPRPYLSSICDPKFSFTSDPFRKWRSRMDHEAEASIR